MNMIIASPNAPFLAPPSAEEETPAPRTSDCGEVAMHRLRNPFAIAADTTPHRVSAQTATQAVHS